MTTKTEQLLAECELQQQQNAAQLAQVTAQWSEAARTGADCEELEQLIERCNLVSKRLVLRREALELQQQADIEQVRLADIERVTDECNAIAAGITQQYKAISTQSEKLACMFDKVLTDGQTIYNKIHELMLLGADEVPAEIRALDLGSFSTKERAGAFHHKQNAVYALSERIVNNATQRIKTKR